MTTHKVKSWAHFFDAIKAGNKLHDLRKLDRDYKVGDILVLQRYDNIEGEYTGEELEVEISYITSNKVPCAFSSSALDKNYAILSLKKKEITKFVVSADQFFLDDDRTAKIVRKVAGYANGGRVNGKASFLVGERKPEEIYLNPVSPNPNAEYYQNG